MTELPKTFEPRAIEERWYAHWEISRPVPAGAPRQTAVDDRHAAAQRHRQPAYRPRARHHAPGRPHPPRADAWQGRFVGGRYRPCRDRHADGCRAQPRRAAGQAHQLQPRRIRRQGVGVEGRERRRDHAPAAPPRRVVRLGARALHHGRGLLSAPSPHSSSSSTRASSPTATSGWSTGTPNSRPRSATSRSRRATSRASSGP